MPRTVDKAEAIELLEHNRRELLEDSPGCVLCAVVRRARERAEIIAESDHGVVVLDRFGARVGHSLVIARAHLEELTELGWPVYSDLQRLAYRACAVVRSALAPVRTFVAVLGASIPLPMSFPHFHIHVVPVYEQDERARPAQVFSWSAGVLVYEDAEARALIERLRAAWTELEPSPSA